MPKLIDLETKKLDIAYATWKLIAQEGIEAASVRNIAKEAGITLGALRYYFTSQQELLLFTEEVVHATLAEKTTELFSVELQPREKILNLLLGLLPLAEEVHSAAAARMVFKLQAIYPNKSFNHGRDSVYQAVKSVMSNLVMLNLLKKDTDLSVETERLYMLMDGIAMNIMLGKKGDKPINSKLLLKMHMHSICKETTEELL